MVVAHIPTYLVGVVRTADKVKQYGHWIRSGIRDSALPCSCQEKTRVQYYNRQI